MIALLTLLLALVATTPSVSLKVAVGSGELNVRLHFTVTGPYEGRACVDIDRESGEHATLTCADELVSVKAGATAEVDYPLHGPAGSWVIMPVLPDTPGEDDVVTGEPQHVAIHANGPGLSVSR